MKFQNLSTKEKRIVLDWMAEGLNAAVKKQIMVKSYRALVRSLNGGDPYDPEALFNSLENGTKEHFQHIVAAQASLDKLRPVPPAPPVVRTRLKKARKKGG